tara:strand:+ start:188 stop:703 length:516 start_codon:yes stop_codon:yes gene_type:complete
MSTNLQFITSSSASSVSDLSITNCFTAKYNVYQVVIDNIDFASADLKFRFINASGTVTSANYDSAVLLQRSYGSFADNRTTDGTEFRSIGFFDQSGGIGAGKGGATVITIYNPFNSSTYSFANWQNAGVSSIGTPVRKGIGVLTVAESHTGINFTASSTILGVSASVYGVK